MTTASRDPLVDTDRLLVDGTNLLHALSRRTGAAPAAALIGRLRGAIPATVAIEVIFDGPPERGMRGERIASGLTVRYSGRRPADDLLVELVDTVRAARGASGSAATSRLLIVTDDIGLREALRTRGARTAGSAWLLGRLDRGTLSSPSVGNRRPTAPQAPPDEIADASDARRWRPGRGATSKKGNPRRGHPPSGRMPP